MEGKEAAVESKQMRDFVELDGFPLCPLLLCLFFSFWIFFFPPLANGTTEKHGKHHSWRLDGWFMRIRGGDEEIRDEIGFNPCLDGGIGK